MVSIFPLAQSRSRLLQLYRHLLFQFFFSVRVFYPSFVCRIFRILGQEISECINVHISGDVVMRTIRFANCTCVCAVRCYFSLHTKEERKPSVDVVP